MYLCVMIQPEAPCHSQSVAVIDEQLWEYGVTSWGCKVSRDNMGTVS